ncbi:hypothetical protein FGI21_01010 [Dickeya zeae]|uniref:Uncharacterized protein n=1 Tax=Dickeya zeae TaxID=204042 RepID=A0ABX8VTH4_9GAMM|nr:hypothetical protein FGI21_01010 [Dickeya zeae]
MERKSLYGDYHNNRETVKKRSGRDNLRLDKAAETGEFADYSVQGRTLPFALLTMTITIRMNND